MKVPEKGTVRDNIWSRISLIRELFKRCVTFKRDRTGNIS